MKRQLVFLPDVSTDFAEVWNHYEGFSPGHGGDRFETAYREVLMQIKAGLVTHRTIFGNFHRVFVDRYPYTLYYRITQQDSAVIVALLYARFDPKHIKELLQNRK